MQLPAQVHRHHPRLEVLTQFLLIFGAAIVYFAVRGLTQGSVERANANARTILRVENWMGLGFEEAAQDLILDNRALITLSNWIYIWGHWPFIALTLYALHRIGSPHYILLRNAMFLSGAIGIVVFVAFPVAPPRLLDPAYTDTVTDLSTSYHLLQPPALVNKFAAMPSLHVGWNLLAGIAIFRASNQLLFKAISVLSPLAMGVAVVLTANHYILDVTVGALVALIGLVIAQRMWLRHYGPRWSAATDVVIDLRDQRQVIDDQAACAQVSKLKRTG